jgi:hypothetical protein
MKVPLEVKTGREILRNHEFESFPLSAREKVALYSKKVGMLFQSHRSSKDISNFVEVSPFKEKFAENAKSSCKNSSK